MCWHWRGLLGADTAFIETREQRHPFVAPGVSSGALATGGYERDLERQIADTFPLRTWLVETYDYAKFAWLGESTSVNVIRGRDGWLFLGAEESRYVTGGWTPSSAPCSPRSIAVSHGRARCPAA